MPSSIWRRTPDCEKCMSRKFCFVYQWATYGGVERVFLNRAQAFEASGRDVEMEIYYGSDGGGLSAFNRTIRHLGFEDRLRVVPHLDPARYEAVFVIDSPALLPARPGPETHWVVECHTPYADNRRYLGDLPEAIRQVLVPSRTFARCLSEERPEMATSIRLLRNCVSPVRPARVPRLPGWTKQLLLYFGRLDELKNPQGFLDLCVELERRTPGRYSGLILGPEVKGYGMVSRIELAGLRGKVIQMPPLPFLETSTFLAAWRSANGVMVSPSLGESFGLAAAESIAAGIPVLLSNLPEHSELVGGDDRHLYDVRDVRGGADKVERMFAGYAQSSERMAAFAETFSDAAFLRDWDDLMGALGLEPGSLQKIDGEVAA